MVSFFNENGFVNLDDYLMNAESFRKIMEDGIVTDAELKEQADIVTGLFKQMEQKCNDEQKQLIADAFTELGVLFAIYTYKELNSIK